MAFCWNCKKICSNPTVALENGECVIGLYIDFSKTFDTVNHAILLDKLELYGICSVGAYRTVYM